MQVAKKQGRYFLEKITLWYWWHANICLWKQAKWGHETDAVFRFLALLLRAFAFKNINSDFSKANAPCKGADPQSFQEWQALSCSLAA